MKGSRISGEGLLVKALVFLGVMGLMGVWAACGDSEPVGPGGKQDVGAWQTDLPPNSNPDGPPAVESCVDNDGDGYGIGAGCKGMDCDDADPQLTIICGGVEPTCTGPHDMGCTCPTEGAIEVCYSSNPALMNVGACLAGQQTCRSGFWSPCEGEVFPSLEVCDSLDNDCDGQVDDGLVGCNNIPPVCTDPNTPGCPCAEGSTQPCFSGNPMLRGVGACTDGMQTCQLGAWGACLGEGVPSTEICDQVDNDCDGVVDEGYPPNCGGPLPTCEDFDMDGYGNGAACVGLDCDDTNPALNVDCSIVNPNCDIPATPGCPCEPTESTSCYSGDPSLRGVGVCKEGFKSCRAGFWTPCEGEVLPSAEICDRLDNNCDGQVDEGFPPNCEVSNDCIDQDGDGFGVGADCQGPDCDDADPTIHTGCTQSCDDPGTEGCPCTPMESMNCYSGNPGQAGVGVCAEGVRNCVNLLWGPCTGEVLPSAEICDSLDNDCNGQVDELAECGQSVIIGQDGEPFVLEGGNAEGIELNPMGSLVLGQSNVEETFVWIANSEEGTVSKLDSRTGHEVARYVSALPGAGAPVWNEPCSRSGNCPSRTAVDLKGNVWVANRALGGNNRLQGSVTKIANAINDCVDRDGDGNIYTSQDVSGDGRIDLNDDGEFAGEADECILFTVPIGTPGGFPRALGICTSQDPYQLTYGNPWVGVYSNQMVVELDNDTGEILQQVAVPLHPYGAVCDKEGTLWVTSSGWSASRGCEGFVAVNTKEGTVGPLIDTPAPTGCSGKHGCYGISLDTQSRVWLGGYPCEAAFRYDPIDGSMITVNTPGRGVGRGISADTNGMVWLAHSWTLSGNPVGHITGIPESGEGPHVDVNIPDGSGSIGSGIDNDGNVWVVNESSNNATRYNPTTGETQSFPVGRGPYTYSDYTGYTLRNMTQSSGWYTQLVSGGCTEGLNRWMELSWEAYVPEGSQVYLEVRSATFEEELATMPWSETFTASPANLASVVAPGNFLEVRVTLRSVDLVSTPTFYGMDVAYECF